MTTYWTWDSRRASKLRAAGLWLSTYGMTPAADRTSGKTAILFSCHTCLISCAKSWYLVYYYYYYFTLILLLITVTVVDSETATFILRHFVAISTSWQAPVSSILLQLIFSKPQFNHKHQYFRYWRNEFLRIRYLPNDITGFSHFCSNITDTVVIRTYGVRVSLGVMTDTVHGCTSL